MWDTVVIGSGIAGLTAAAALARRGQRVLVLEQHHTPGGLTQTFRRADWTFAPGVHYLADVGAQPGPGGPFGRLLAWLGDGTLRFADSGNPYDVVRLPGFEFAIEHPEAAYRAALEARFPAQGPAIARWFDEMHAARKAAFTLFALRGLPPWLAWGLRLWRGAELDRMRQRTLAEALAEIPDARLRAVLGARWGDHGAPPETAPLVEHALITGAYDAGSWYPVGGPARLAQSLLPTVLAAGGQIELGASVERITLTGGRADGVVYRRNGTLHPAGARQLISAMGVRNTVDCLDREVAPAWQAEVRGFRPGLSYLSLFLGFEGDIAAAGASSANVWVYESEAVGPFWRAPADEDAPGLFVSFPSLKDPACAGQPTAEVVAFCDAEAFAPWLQAPGAAPADGDRPEDYLAFKAWVEERLLAQFLRHFPALAPLLRFHEMSTPVTQQHFVRTPGGATYGIEMDAARLGSPALNVRSPVPGLLLAGQDVSGAGVPAAGMSGLLAAAALEPALLRQLGG
ncbi:MAG: NAD(P)/FAD-dependent oxidoreductase [Burkholderiaceae bacterium]|nr:NAD(P)/FAD-dependent oxidoreductase [Burkholderiaceae bacterium]